MSLIQIPIFDGGLVTNSDPEDIPKTAATESKNFEIDVPGKLIKRKGRGAATTMSGDHPGQIVKWKSPDFTPSKWIYYETQTKKIRSAAANFGSNADIKTLSTIDDIKINTIPQGPSYYVNAVYPEIEPSSEDTYLITSYEDRLDLLAYDYYGDERLWWVISRANPDVTRRDVLKGIGKGAALTQAPAISGLSSLAAAHAAVTNVNNNLSAVQNFADVYRIAS